MVIVEKGTKPQEAKEVTTEEVATEAPKEVSESTKEKKSIKMFLHKNLKQKKKTQLQRGNSPKKRIKISH